MAFLTRSNTGQNLSRALVPGFQAAGSVFGIQGLKQAKKQAISEILAYEQSGAEADEPQIYAAKILQILGNNGLEPGETFRTLIGLKNQKWQLGLAAQATELARQEAERKAQAQGEQSVRGRLGAASSLAPLLPTATPDERARRSATLRSVLLGQGPKDVTKLFPEEPKPAKPFEGLSAGYETFLRANGLENSPESYKLYQEQEAGKKGKRIVYGQDGNPILVEGPASMEVPVLSKPTKTKIEQKYLDTTDQLNRLKKIGEDFRPEFLQLGTRWTALKTRWGEKAGFRASTKDKQLLSDFSAFKRDTLSNINQYIKFITGAQMSEREADRIRAALPDVGDGFFAGDSPTEFVSKWKAAVEELEMVQRRYRYLIAQGYSAEAIEKLAEDDALNKVAPLSPQMMPDSMLQWMLKDMEQQNANP